MQRAADRELCMAVHFGQSRDSPSKALTLRLWSAEHLAVVGGGCVVFWWRQGYKAGDLGAVNLGLGVPLVGRTAANQRRNRASGSRYRAHNSGQAGSQPQHTPPTWATGLIAAQAQAGLRAGRLALGCHRLCPGASIDDATVAVRSLAANAIPRNPPVRGHRGGSGDGGSWNLVALFVIFITPHAIGNFFVRTHPVAPCMCTKGNAYSDSSKATEQSFPY